MSEELKPCPFCGSEPRIVTAVGVSWVLCDKCKANTEAHTSRQFAIAAWNRRVTEYRKPTTLSQLEAENAKLRELIVRCCDCESAKEHYEGMDVWWCGFLTMYVGSGDFCCWGKRREDA